MITAEVDLPLNDMVIVSKQCGPGYPPPNCWMYHFSIKLKGDLD